MKTISKEKGMKILSFNIIITFLVSSLLAFCIDGFVMHPIPRQMDTEVFDLAMTGIVYADAIVLDESHAVSQFGDVFLVDWQGETHLVYFKHHFLTGRHALVSDVVITDTSLHQIKVGTIFEQAVVFVEDGRIANLSTGPLSVSFYYHIYALIGMMCTAFESAIFWRLLKRKIK